MSDRSLKPLGLILPALLMTACVEYTIETTVNPDGSGLRVERMEAVEHPDLKVDREVFPRVMHVTSGDGWNHSTERDSDGDTIEIFLRKTEIADLPSWADITGHTRIDGAPDPPPTPRVGYVELADVRFRNAVRVQRAADSDGPTTFSYRETFSWDRVVDALMEYLVAEVDARIEERFPSLSPSERGQIVGFVRARLWTAAENGLLSGDVDDDAMLEEIVRLAAGQGIYALRGRKPSATQEDLEEVLRSALLDTDERLVYFLERMLPGVNIALNSEIVFRLNLPGRVTNSNAHRRDGTTLVWQFGPADAFYTPVEIFAESVVGEGRGTGS